MVGGEWRKSRKPFAVAESKTPATADRATPARPKNGPSSKNTNLNGLNSFTLRNVLNKVSSQCKVVISWPARTMTSSENAGDLRVENISMMASFTQAPGPTCRDRRALSRDRSTLGNEGERAPVHRQCELADKLMHSCLPTGLSLAWNRKVSSVSAHASNRTGAQFTSMRRYISRNRRPPHEAARCTQVSVQWKSLSVSRPRSFGVEDGTRFVGSAIVETCWRPPQISTSSRFEKRERKYDS